MKCPGGYDLKIKGEDVKCNFALSEYAPVPCVGSKEQCKMVRDYVEEQNEPNLRRKLSKNEK